MLLANKNAVVYGAGGAMGRAVARAFAEDGATVHLAGRTAAPLEAVAAEITAAGGTAHVGVVDALDEAAVDDHLDEIGHVDISFNLISHGDVHGVPLLDIEIEDFVRPIHTAVVGNFTTMRSAARRMVKQQSGVILTLTSPPAKLVGPLMGGTAVAESAIETFTRCLAAEIGLHGVRVLGLRSEGIPGAWAEDWHTNVFDTPVEATDGLDPEGHANVLAERTMLQRTPTLAEMTSVAVFLASDRAAAMTGTITNMTCGSVPD
ncbi:SDR family NAD(P)-dependent oxidoreductase [Amycolatopsis magusensis]|uniref:SDR family NAD(P)-dependent oxidoreductase n=1 Tax=Amycolatopsis magusensis TaxID=882444 RepID=UPI0037AC3550